MTAAHYLHVPTVVAQYFENVPDLHYFSILLQMGAKLCPPKKTCPVATRVTGHDAFQFRTMHPASLRVD